ncbi:MAG: alpha/beta hydrolase [Chloroflexi bacterium]|nr:alpha/beta hydrolase [Chloroflexota bacterium]
MPLNPKCGPLIDGYNARYGGKPRTAQTLPGIRAQMEAALALGKPKVASVEDRRIPGPHGEIPFRVYKPLKAGRPLPVLVTFHGGGWTIGSVNSHDGTARRLALAAECAVVSVDYRLAPEHKFPIPFDDCYAAMVWVAEHSRELGVDGARIAVGGDSSGGNLAAAVALKARDAGGPKLAFQLLIYPALDRNLETASYRQNASGYLLTRETMAVNWALYLGSEADAKNPYACPIQAKDLRGLPPALIITAEYDPLRDDGDIYAKRLRAADVPVAYTCYEGMIHAFFSYSEVLAEAKQALAQAGEALKKAFRA